VANGQDDTSGRYRRGAKLSRSCSRMVQGLDGSIKAMTWADDLPVLSPDSLATLARWALGGLTAFSGDTGGG
jgi:hypothetical protein